MENPNQVIYYYIRTGKIISQEELESIYLRRTRAEGSIGIASENQKKQIQNGFIINPQNIEHTVIIREQDILDDSLIRLVNAHAQKVRLEELAKFTNERDSQRKNAYPQEEAALIRENARKKSATPQKSSTKRSKSKTYSVKQKLALALLIITVAASTLGINKAYEEISTNTAIRKADQAITLTLNENEGVDKGDIVSRDTHRTNDNQNYWYDVDEIAQSILSLPPELFDVSLYVTYYDMASNATRNIDDLIRSLTIYANQDTHPLAFSKLDGCSSFNDYLIKNGYVNENGEPSVDKFVETGRTLCALNSDYIASLNDEGKGTR